MKQGKNKNDNNEKKIEEVENKLAELCAEKNIKIVRDEIKVIDNAEGGKRAEKIWKLKKKLSPMSREPPTIKHDKKGNIVSSATGLKNLYTETYK